MGRQNVLEEEGVLASDMLMQEDTEPLHLIDLLLDLIVMVDEVIVTDTQATEAILSDHPLDDIGALQEAGVLQEGIEGAAVGAAVFPAAQLATVAEQRGVTAGVLCGVFRQLFRGPEEAPKMFLACWRKAGISPGARAHQGQDRGQGPDHYLLLLPQNARKSRGLHQVARAERALFHMETGLRILQAEGEKEML